MKVEESCVVIPNLEKLYELGAGLRFVGSESDATSADAWMNRGEELVNGEGIATHLDGPDPLHESL